MKYKQLLTCNYQIFLFAKQTLFAQEKTDSLNSRNRVLGPTADLQ